jgi:hypothetical protein
MNISIFTRLIEPTYIRTCSNCSKPWDIATTSFDGFKSTKWEEPDGEKGS